jgi:Rrf2 family transcriptional regulator, nitric oxide-sensitive transcriptional repressor
MRLTRFTDYAMRVLFYLATKNDKLVTVGEIAKIYEISQHHLVKVVQDLVKYGYVESVKGRGGGMRLAIAPSEINLGAIVRRFEPEMKLIDCVGCHIAGACSLPGPLHKAVIAFINVLSEYSLQDIVSSSPQMASLLELS